MKKILQLGTKQLFFLGMFILFAGNAFAYTPPTALQVAWTGSDQSSTCHQFGDYITNVTFAGINNTTTVGTSGWHFDYGRTTPQVTPGEVTIGQSYPISVTVTGQDLGYQYIAVYVDWNQNNVNGTPSFPYILDANENPVVWYGNTGTGSKTLTGTINVPAGISPGQIYMRVMLDADTGGANGGDYTCAVGFGEFEDYVLNVKAALIPPVATTGSSSSISTTGATLNGTINANNASTTVTFEYGTTTGYGSSVTADQSPVTGSTAISVSKAIMGLIPNTTYHFRVVGVSTSGTTNGLDQSFTTLAALPSATTSTATTITTTGATLNGSINANNASTSVTFDYGLTTGYGSSATATPGTVAGTSNTSVSASLTGLTPNTTYHYRVKGVNSAGTTNGLDGSFTTNAASASSFQTAGNWSLASNWSAGIPGSATEATISANCTVDGNFTTGNLIISSTASLTISSGNTLTSTGDLDLESDNNGTGSLINSGTLNVSGIITAQRYMTGNKWHLVSPVAAGSSISTFIQATGNAIPLSGSNYGMMDYNETTNSWKPFFTTVTVGNLTAGKGYNVRRSSSGTVAFTGTLTSGTKTVPLTKVGTEGWNCVGNPYPSAIGINTLATSAENLITKNIGILDGSYACVYVWDEDATYSGQNLYKIISNSGFTIPGKTNLLQNYIAPGQGFFVKTAANNNTLQFTALMQSQQVSTIFRSPANTTSWPGIALNAASADASSSTIITFNRNMTNGLDPTYDAGLLRGTNGLSLYTRLVEDNGVDFSVQCLPENYNNLVIPVGIDCKAGGDVTFSAENVALPTECNVVLEDKTTGILTLLSDGAGYKATLPAETSGIGRFYIHTNLNLSTGKSEITAEINKLKAYITNGMIIIEGEVTDQAIATLYNLQGQKVRVKSLQKGSMNTLSCPELMNGIYMLTIQQNGEIVTRKLIK